MNDRARPILPILPIFLILALAALSCHRVPATLQTAESGEPARTESKVFVESQPDERELEGSFPSISPRLASLYSCWFESPYEYMFEYRGDALEVHGRPHGMLMAGISGILYYGDFNECAGRLVGEEPRSYSDYGPIETLAGVSATLPSGNLPFDVVNPEFISWARSQLLPAPEQTIEGIPVQLAYERVFQRFFRVMSESLFWVVEHQDLDTEVAEYMRDVKRGQDGIDWLEARYAAIPAHGGYADGTTMSAPMAAGFWLRRKLDGSLADCWHGLHDVLVRYDRPWLDDLRARHPKAAAFVELLPDRLDTGAKP